MTGTVLVTGASGFVGRTLCASLAAGGVRVRGLVRERSAHANPGVEYAVAPDLLDRRALRSALAGVDAVVHLAARVHVMRDTAHDPLAEFRRVNVEGTRAVLEEGADAGIRRFVYFSSVKAVGEASSTPWTESTPAHPVDPYGVSKLEAEHLVREISAAAAIHATALRLPLVYGPGVKGNMLQLFRLVDRGTPLPFGSLHNRRSMAFVGNVVAAVRAVLDAPTDPGGTYFVSDGRDLSTPELIAGIARALGRPARLIPVPTALLRALGGLGDAVSRVAPFPFTSAMYDRLAGSLVVDASAITRDTGFRPPFTVEQGLAETADWYRRVALREGM